MYRLSAQPGIAAGLLVLAVGSWWLATIAMQIAGGSQDLRETGATAAAILVIGQWLMIALLTTTAGVDERTRRGDLVALSLPLWPLIALLWLTTSLSLHVLVATQVLALLLASTLIEILSRFASKVRDKELQHMFAAALGVAYTSILWLQREPVVNWITS